MSGSDDLNLAVGRVFQESDTDETPQSLAEAIRGICLRPRMVTYSEEFAAAGIYIDGFVAGRGVRAQETLERFRNWLAQYAYAERGLPRNHVWQWYLTHLYPTDEARFAALPGLFERFLQEEPAR